MDINPTIIQTGNCYKQQVQLELLLNQPLLAGTVVQLGITEVPPSSNSLTTVRPYGQRRGPGEYLPAAPHLSPRHSFDMLLADVENRRTLQCERIMVFSSCAPLGSVPEYPLHDDDPANHANHAQAGRRGEDEGSFLYWWVFLWFSLCYDQTMN